MKEEKLRLSLDEGPSLIEVKRKYYYSNDGRTTACVLDMVFTLRDTAFKHKNECYCINLPAQLVDKVSKKFPEFKIDLGKEGYCWKYQVKGKSICHEKDAFSQSLGEKIASVKAQEKAIHIAARILTTILDELEKSVERTQFAAMKMYTWARRENVYLSKLINNEDNN